MITELTETHAQLASSYQKIALIMTGCNSQADTLSMQESPWFSVHN